MAPLLGPPFAPRGGEFRDELVQVPRGEVGQPPTNDEADADPTMTLGSGFRDHAIKPRSQLGGEFKVDAVRRRIGRVLPRHRRHGKGSAYPESHSGLGIWYPSYMGQQNPGGQR